MHGRVGGGEEGRVGLDIGYQADSYSVLFEFQARLCEHGHNENH